MARRGDPTLRVGGEDSGDEVRRAEEGENLGDATRGGQGKLSVASGAWALGTVRGDAAASVAYEALEYCEFGLLDDGATALRCEQQTLTRNGARTKGFFSITCHIRILQLLLLLCRFIGVLARMLVLADAMHAAMQTAYGAKPIDKIYAVQGCITFMLARVARAVAHTIDEELHAHGQGHGRFRKMRGGHRVDAAALARPRAALRPSMSLDPWF